MTVRPLIMTDSCVTATTASHHKIHGKTGRSAISC